jgi:hypothetical protein
LSGVANVEDEMVLEDTEWVPEREREVGAAAALTILAWDGIMLGELTALPRFPLDMLLLRLGPRADPEAAERRGTTLDFLGMPPPERREAMDDEVRRAGLDVELSVLALGWIVLAAIGVERAFELDGMCGRDRGSG